MPESPEVPDYEPMLAAYHRAFARELREMIGVLPITPGMQVLDMACGDGVYGPWLAERVGPSGRVVSVDVSPAYLKLAHEAAARGPHGGIIDFVEAPIESLPFPPGAFDLAWCAQSLYSLPDPVEAVRFLAKATKPGGIVAVLEDDTIHHLILPWPAEVELGVRLAELDSQGERTKASGKLYAGRQLRRIFGEAGIVEICQKSFATDRMAPLGDDERTYLAEYLKSVREKVGSRLEGSLRDQFDGLVDPASNDFLPDDPDLVVTCIDHVVWGAVPPVR